MQKQNKKKLKNVDKKKLDILDSFFKILWIKEVE